MTLNPILDTSTLSKELNLQLQFIRSEDVHKIDSKYFSEVDWDEFYDLLLHHRTFSYVYPKLKLVPYVPARILDKLEKLYRYYTFEMMHLAGEMNKVSTMFQQNGIRPIFLKGPVLAKELYGDLSLRMSNDLDVLIPIQDLDKAHELLVKEGYVKSEFIRTVLGDWKWRHYHVIYFHPEKDIKLEVHWRLSPGPGKEPSFDELWKRRRASSLCSNTVFMLGLEDLFLFLVTHGARHGWSRLRWLTDISLLLKQDFNEAFLKRHLKRYQAEQLGGHALLLASNLLRTLLTEELKDLTIKKQAIKIAQQTMFYLENKINLHNDPVPEWVSSYHEKYLFTQKSFLQKFVFVMSFFYPYPEDMDVLPLPQRFHFLYFPLRPVIWAWKKMRTRVESLQ
jgi:Uncharacterised nucleotidyltransferase